MQTVGTPSSVWQRRTHRLVAAAVIVIGLTMMISNISQCIYMGMVFIMVALVWLGWMTMKERKAEPPSPLAHQSPVLFLVTSHMLPSMSRSTAAHALDKPPSYDTIVSLDGLPPDYSSVQFEKPPRYEEVAALYKAARNSDDFAPHEASAGPSGVVNLEKADQAGEETSGCREIFDGHHTLSAAARRTVQPVESDGPHSTVPSDENLNNVPTRTTFQNSENKDRSTKINQEERECSSRDVHVQKPALDDTEQSGTRMSRLHPKRSSLSRSFRMRQDLRKENRERKRNASANDGRNFEASTDSNLSPTKSLLRLQVPTLSQDIASSAARYLDSTDNTNSALPSVHSQSFSSRRSRTLPSAGVGCGAPPSMSDFDASSVDRAEARDRQDDETGRTSKYSCSDAPQLSTSRV